MARAPGEAGVSRGELLDERRVREVAAETRAREDVNVVVAGELRGTRLGARLADPQRLLADPAARFVKDHLRTAVAAAAVEGREVFVKRFKPYAWYRRLEWLLV